ncbi:MAG: DUF3108 domain-containing protein [Burkholderiales bacterium]|nr:DUF3108 domain-containing protein [Burkholderiales bacterium]
MNATTLPAPAARRTAPAASGVHGRVLAIALAASLALHVAATFWPVELPSDPEAIVLSATITELPPPPLPAPAPPAPKPKAKPKPKLSAPPVAAPVEPAPEPEPAAPADAPPVDAAPPREAEPVQAPPALVEETARAELPPAPSMKTLPARVDLTYRVTYGPGIYIGDATYRFEHAANRYTVSTVGEARGLAALVLRGQGRIDVRGLITAQGLQPWELAVERGSRDRREVATFDWESGIATLTGDKTAALELPTFDPLSLMWQFYFVPPTGDEQVFNLVTTRRVMRITVKREGTETVAWPYGDVAAERWHRTSEDGRTESIVWLAPSLRYLPIRMRISHTLRGTLEVELASIRVDDGERGE